MSNEQHDELNDDMKEEIYVIEEGVDTDIGKQNVLYEGEYMIFVPKGQKATVIYDVVDTNETNES